MVTWSITWKEFRSLIFSPVAYIFLMIFVGVLGAQYFVFGTQNVTFFTQGIADLTAYFGTMPLAMAVLVPALAMKLWPDELKSGTVELLFSYPLRSWQVVLGKFFAGMLLIVAGLALTLTVPCTVDDYGLLDWGPVWGAYLASILLGAAFLSIGLFMGALCKEQVTAFILTAIIGGLFVRLGDMLANLFLPKSWHGFSNAFSFSTRFNDFGRGVVGLDEVVFFGSFAAVFLVLNVVVMECRKGR